jgi:hypothetical protein
MLTSAASPWWLVALNLPRFALLPLSLGLPLVPLSLGLPLVMQAILAR